MTRAGRLSGLAAALLAAAAIHPMDRLRAQSDAQPTFRASTTLVQFTLVAEDHSGNPVTDLRQDEIQIVEGRQKRDVAFFRFEGSAQNATASAPVPTLPRGVFSNRPEFTVGAPRNITAIVIDALNTRAQDQLTVRAQVMRYLSTITPDTRVALYRAGEHMQVLHDFTSDMRSLRAHFDQNALEAPVHTGVTVTVDVPGVAEYDRGPESETVDILELANREQARVNEKSNQQIQDVRSELTLHALEVLGNHLAAIPGRKSVVWITPGTPMTSMGAGDKWVANYEKAVRALARRMATQGITLYPVEAFGIRPPDLSQVAQPASPNTNRSTVSSRIAAARAMANEATERTSPTDERRLPSAMETLAEVTGGRIIRNTNDLTDGMKQAAADLRGAYSVGFYVPQNPDNEWHPFEVRVSRPGVKLIHRQGYLGLPDHKPQEWLDEDWRAASNNPLGSTAVRIDAKCTLIGDSLNVITNIPGEDLQFRRVSGKPTTELDVALAEKVPQGLVGVRHQVMAFQITEADMADLSQVRVRFPVDWPLKTTSQTLRLLIRDRYSDKYGTIDFAIKDLIR